MQVKKKSPSFGSKLPVPIPSAKGRTMSTDVVSCAIVHSFKPLASPPIKAAYDPYLSSEASPTVYTHSWLVISRVYHCKLI